MNNSEDNKKTFRPTVDWMAEKYDEMNALLFNNDLSSCYFKVFTSGRGSQGRTLGFFRLTGSNLRYKRNNREIYQYDEYDYDIIYVNRENFFDICEPLIALNGNYSGTEEAFLNTLVHEMCHYYTYMRGFVPKQAHGTDFRYVCDMVCARSNGRFIIQRLASAEEMKSYELDADIKAKNDARREKLKATRKSSMNAIFMFETNGKITLTTTSSQKLIDRGIEYLKYNHINKVIISNDQHLIEILMNKGYNINMRTFKYWYVNDEEILNILDKSDKKIYTKEDMTENKININRIINEVINKYIDDEVMNNGNNMDVDINPNMNLGIEIPE
jgi:hypothetical protein